MLSIFILISSIFIFIHIYPGVIILKLMIVFKVDIIFFYINYLIL